MSKRSVTLTQWLQKEPIPVEGKSDSYELNV